MLATGRAAEEAVQETFIRGYRALPKYEEREAFEPWLFRILANRCRSAGAREKRRSMFVPYGDVPQPGRHPGLPVAIVSPAESRRGPAALPVEQPDALPMRPVEAP